MSGVALVAHHERETARSHAIFAAVWCSEHRHDFWMPGQDADALGLPEHQSDRPVAEADLVLSLGGDGTMLRSVGLLDGAATPLLGVNLGSLGYLTEVEPVDLAYALTKFFSGPETGEWSIDDRMMLDV